MGTWDERVRIQGPHDAPPWTPRILTRSTLRQLLRSLKNPEAPKRRWNLLGRESQCDCVELKISSNTVSFCIFKVKPRNYPCCCCCRQGGVHWLCEVWGEGWQAEQGCVQTNSGFTKGGENDGNEGWSLVKIEDKGDQTYCRCRFQENLAQRSCSHKLKPTVRNCCERCQTNNQSTFALSLLCNFICKSISFLSFLTRTPFSWTVSIFRFVWGNWLKRDSLLLLPQIWTLWFVNNSHFDKKKTFCNLSFVIVSFKCLNFSSKFQDKSEIDTSIAPTGGVQEKASAFSTPKVQTSFFFCW